jgi:hypothetical protein
MKAIGSFLLCVALSLAGPLWGAGNDDVYNDEALRNLKYKPAPGSEWKEQDLVVPPYPSEDDLVEVDIDRHDYPYTLFVDTKSVSVGQDDIIRYTVVLRSESGVDNISFEGLLCNRREYKRYAYGSEGKFYPIPNADWRRIQAKRQDIYRGVLADDYFCPLPTGNRVPQLISRLKGRGAAGYLFPGD